MPYTLLLFRCDPDRLERLNEHLRAYHVESVETLPAAEAALTNNPPDALIAPITNETLHLFASLETHFLLRPLLVLITETPKIGLPADLVLPARWLDQPLQAALQRRSDTIQLQRKLDQEIGSVAAATRRTAQEVDLLKNAIVRTVSHELKTPLLHVKSAVSMLSDDHFQDRSKLIGYATEATARLEAVVKNVTQLANILEITPEPIFMPNAVAHAERNLRRTWEHKNDMNRLKIDVSPYLPLVWADEQAIGIALQLLIDNALKFSEKEVEITAVAQSGHVLVTVRDYGIGIPPDKLELIFEPFYQIDSSDARRFGGIGVGLAIVRSILERHHSTISVTSVLGEGSTLSFVLPCVD